MNNLVVKLYFFYKAKIKNETNAFIFIIDSFIAHKFKNHYRPA